MKWTGKIFLSFLMLLILCLGSCDQSPTLLCTLKIVNHSSLSINYLYIAPSTNYSWGVNQLQTDPVGPNSTCSIKNIPPGNYDLKAIFSNWQSVTRYGVVFTSGETKVWTFY